MAVFAGIDREHNSVTSPGFRELCIFSLWKPKLFEIADDKGTSVFLNGVEEHDARTKITRIAEYLSFSVYFAMAALHESVPDLCACVNPRTGN